MKYQFQAEEVANSLSLNSYQRSVCNRLVNQLELKGEIQRIRLSNSLSSKKLRGRNQYKKWKRSQLKEVIDGLIKDDELPARFTLSWIMVLKYFVIPFLKKLLFDYLAEDQA